MKPKSIILIDDNSDFISILSMTLQLYDYSVETAYTGLDGIIKVNNIRPDVVICDIGLPDIDGYEVAKIIRNTKDIENTYLIALSGYIKNCDIEQPDTDCFDLYINKPIEFKVLNSILEKINL